VKYLLDTNACIAFLNLRPAGVAERVRRLLPADLVLCSIVKSELVFGAHKSAKAAENLARLEVFFRPIKSLPFDDHAAAIAGELRAQLERSGTPIGPNDLLIGAIALAHGLTLVTANTRELAHIPGLRLEDWTRPHP